MKIKINITINIMINKYYNKYYDNDALYFYFLFTLSSRVSLSNSAWIPCKVLASAPVAVAAESKMNKGTAVNAPPRL